ncbi:TonB-dependent hemoglobin/transferrin/lactoferrin family receptor [Chthonobacter albigriseus]|uniref:TonB-dependent hemoglobin/transferrin/lactoferrin family receptor n=1 Tax=Chthonobacter albigriseus TaxID=1683161 RepID=UPI0015EF9D12|nr:TonB-dependent hemoglobin/transferrin/lactoferrin family receptor [Chthonobacter albigriseus]
MSNGTRSLKLLLLLSTALIARPADGFAQDAVVQPEATPAVDCPEGQPCLQPGGEITLDTITLSASRTEGAPIDALAGVSVVTPGQPSNAGARRATDLLATVPGVAVASDGTDQSTVVNVRGLQDSGRVAVTVDGARQNFSQNGHGTTGVFLPDPFLIGKATVVRGPIANLYGSGAIGGVVSFDTISPSDLLGEGETWAVETLGAYETNGDGRKAGARAAYRITDSFAVLGALAYRGNDTRRDGSGDPITGSDADDITGLLKAEIQANDFNRITASYLADLTDYTRVASATSAYDTEVFGQTATAKWSYENPDLAWLDFDVSAYWTGTDKTETYVFGANAGRDRTFDIGTLGFDAANTARFDTGPLSHAVTVGVDAFSDDVDTADVPGGTGAVSTPSGERTVYGAYIQDELAYSDWLTVTAALRFDGYDFAGEDTNGDPVEGDGTRFSPKIAVGLTPFEATFARGLELYGSYAEGYRAPSITETLVSGPHPGFDFLPNPNLQPETAHNVEFGLNYSRDDLFMEGDALRLKAGWFHNEVDDFIDGRIGFSGGVMTYQYQNVSQATIEGLELEATYDQGFAFVGLSAARIRGENDITGEALGSIPADRVVGTLGFRFLEERLTVGAQVEAVAGQTRVPSGTPESDNYNLFNLFASYDLTEEVTLGVDVKNLFDTQYVEYLNDDPSPGFSVMFTLNARLGG